MSSNTVNYNGSTEKDPFYKTKIYSSMRVSQIFQL